MLRLRVLDILEEQGHSKYWLFVRMELSYRNFDNLIKNRTTGIRFENIEKLCYFLNCEPDDLFEVVPDEAQNDPSKHVGQATRAARAGTRKKSVKQLEKEAEEAAARAAEKAAAAKAAREEAEAEAAANMPQDLEKPKTIRELNIWKS